MELPSAQAYFENQLQHLYFENYSKELLQVSLQGQANWCLALLNLGADANTYDSEGCTPLQLASRNGDIQV